MRESEEDMEKKRRRQNEKKWKRKEGFLGRKIEKKQKERRMDEGKEVKETCNKKQARRRRMRGKKGKRKPTTWVVGRKKGKGVEKQKGKRA